MRKIHFQKIILISFFMIGCSTIGGYIDDWPELEIKVHKYSSYQINQKCWSSLSLSQKLIGSVALGCATIDLDKKTCDIYIASNSPEYIVNHEIAHCKGGDHPDHGIEEFFEHWLDLHDQVRKNYSLESSPKMMQNADGKIYWDHSSKFGVIPFELIQVAKEYCNLLSNVGGEKFKAIGYHPTAHDINGKTFQMGGYFCIPE
jgi:hypothetical protein